MKDGRDLDKWNSSEGFPGAGRAEGMSPRCAPGTGALPSLQPRECHVRKWQFSAQDRGTGGGMGGHGSAGEHWGSLSHFRETLATGAPPVVRSLAQG